MHIAEVLEFVENRNPDLFPPDLFMAELWRAVCRTDVGPVRRDGSSQLGCVGGDFSEVGRREEDVTHSFFVPSFVRCDVNSGKLQRARRSQGS